MSKSKKPNKTEDRDDIKRFYENRAKRKQTITIQSGRGRPRELDRPSTLAVSYPGYILDWLEDEAARNKVKRVDLARYIFQMAYEKGADFSSVEGSSTDDPARTAAYSLRTSQVEWVEKTAKHLGITKSEVMQKIIENTSRLFPHFHDVQETDT